MTTQLSFLDSPGCCEHLCAWSSVGGGGESQRGAPCGGAVDKGGSSPHSTEYLCGLQRCRCWEEGTVEGPPLPG